MDKGDEWENSHCFDTWFHDYHIIQGNANGVMEMCSRCQDIQYFAIFNDTIDNLNYLSYHLRSALPKYHPYFYHEYQN